MRRMVAAVCVAACACPLAAFALIDINTADTATLDTLPGIGPTLAGRIVEYRNVHGAFATTADIQSVNGIGPATYEDIKHLITVGGGTFEIPEEPVLSATTTEEASQVPMPPVSSYVPPPVPTVFADAGGDRTVIVGADVTFEGRAYNRAQEDVEQVRFLWNFGDGTSAEGPSVIHHYDYPGRYAVTLSISHLRNAVTDRFIVTAEPARIAFRTAADGSVVIENLSGRDLDLSTWIIRNGLREFFLPPHTVVLARASVRISPQTLQFFAGEETVFAYPNGAPVALEEERVVEVEPAPQSAPVPVPVATQVVPRPEPLSEAAPEVSKQPPVAHAAAVSAAPVADTSPYWWFSAAALAALAGFAAIAVNRMGE